MSPSHRSCVLSILLIAALLAACSGQTATTAPPAATPIPPTAASVQPTPVPPTAAPVQPTPVPPTAAPATPVAEPQPVPHQPRPDAPRYGVRGPYAVGVRDFVIEATKETTRPLTVSVWYPALNPKKLPEAITYELGFPTNAQPTFTIAGRALRDAAPDLSGGPYPLLVHSHGGWGFRQDLVYLMEHLASHGFVVMAAGHEDNWGVFFENLYRSEISRPRDISREIDFAEALTAAGGALPGLINTNYVAVSGFSFGGKVALEKVGARLNLVEQQKVYCATMKDLDITCSFYTTPIEEMAKLAGLDALPNGPWPDWSDSRVDVAVLFEPGEGSLGALPVEVKTPVLLIEGTIDAPGYGWDGIASKEKTAVTLENAGHVMFMNACAAQPGMAAGGYFGVCSDPVWDMNRVHDLTNHFVTAFLLAELKGDADAAKALAPENVSFTGVKYETTAYGAPKATLDDATAGKIDAVVKKAMTDYPTPGFAMCVVKDGQVVYNKGFGQADVASNRSVTPQSVFLQASISKSGTAIAVMQLVEQGKIDLDKTVTTYLPYFTMADARYKEITVRMVLSHRAGLPDTPFPWNVPLDPTMSPLEQATRALSDKQLLSPPGTQFSYSNWGYAVLGDMIAKVSGVPFETYMQKNVLAPLGMKSSSYATADVSSDLRVTGYNNPVGTPLKSQLDCDARHAPACTLWSSCDDLAKYAQMLLNKGELNGTRILQSASIDAMWKTASATPFGPPYAEYGFGCFLSAADGHRLIGLAGSINGFNAQVNLVPDKGLAVIAMNNWYVDVPENTSFPAMSAATDVMNLLLGIKAE